MENRYDAIVVKSKLSLLATWRQVAFALLCCERMYPNYLMFTQDSGWGNPDALRKALDIAWLVLGEENSIQEFHELVRACEEAAPDTEDFASDYTSAALDAALSTALLIEILGRFDVQKVLDISQQAFDTVYMYVDCSIVTNAPDDRVILMHPLVRTELAMQQDSLAYLKAVATERQAALHELKAYASRRQITRHFVVAAYRTR
jgi:uncharacterized protein YjaG (DUF416 family)